MSFLEHQKAARRRTRQFVIYYSLAVSLIFLTAYLLIDLGATIFAAHIAPLSLPSGSAPALSFHGLGVALWSAAVTLLVIVCGALTKWNEIKGGGHWIARSLGGRLVNPGTSEFRYRQLLNAIEELAIAAGIDVPPIYILPENKSINAFAAGFTEEDSVIGITEGALLELSRDELQGVLAHEVAHVLNGDIRLDAYVMVCLRGIQLFWLGGRSIFDAVEEGARESARNAQRKALEGQEGDDSAMPLSSLLIPVAIPLCVIGYTGLILGTLIQRAIAREREYLADATAVQLTRHPEALASVLKRLARGESSDRLRARGAREARHLLLSDTALRTWIDWIPTHPPLADRIARLDRDFEGTVELEQISWEGREVQLPREALTEVRRLRHATFSPVAAAALLLHDLPEEIHAATTSVASGELLALALLIDPRPGARTEQIEMLSRSRSESEREHIERLEALVSRTRSRVTCARLVLPVLKALSPERYAELRRQLVSLSEISQSNDVGRYALSRYLITALDRAHKLQSVPAIRYRSLAPVLGPATTFLRNFIALTNEAEQARQDAMIRALAVLVPNVLPSPHQFADCSIFSFEQSLLTLESASQDVRMTVVAAALSALHADGVVTEEEGLLTHALAIALRVNLPPFVPTDYTATGART